MQLQKVYFKNLKNSKFPCLHLIEPHTKDIMHHRLQFADQGLHVVSMLPV